MPLGTLGDDLLGANRQRRAAHAFLLSFANADDREQSRPPCGQSPAKATPILAELRAFLDATIEKVSGKSSLADAFRYAASRSTALTRYVDNGRLEMTNNVAERAMRPLAFGRKSYLFAGSDEGGRRAAIAYTLIKTARLNDLDPEAWLADVINRIADQPINRIEELLPWNWRGDYSGHRRVAPRGHQITLTSRSKIIRLFMEAQTGRFQSGRSAIRQKTI